MRRLIVIAFVLAGLAAFATLAGGAGDSGGGDRKYTVELDNAFGLIKGADLRIAGVRAGKLGDMRLDRKTKRALVDFTVTAAGFGSLRKDVHCEVRPQSLIGEYFVDCLPGRDKEELPVGATIPVEHTSSTVAPDLVNDVLRRPYRERLSIIIGELGAAVAGNGENLSSAVHRAVPALRETDKVLATLAEQNQVIANLVRDGDQVIGDLADNSKDVGRWVTEARQTATASAERRTDIAAGFRRLPEFLARLKPTMAALGRASDAQTPALQNLRASAGRLEELFQRLGPFAEASRPAIRALGRTSVVGRRAAISAQPVVEKLGAFAKDTPELSNNLALILEHLNDPAHAVEEDPRAAKATGREAPTGYSGLEALLAYVFDQNMATNVYDSSVHILKVAPQSNECADYADIPRAKSLGKRCGAALGPNQPGLTYPDPTRPAGAGDADSRAVRHDRKGPAGDRTPPGEDPSATTTPAPASDAPAAPAAPSDGKAAPAPGVPTIDLPQILPGLKDPPPVPLPNLGDRGGLAGKGPLLDYLLGK